MAQWDPEATSYTYPQSQYGGLYCDDNGQLSKPFSDKPYCYDGTGSVDAVSSAGNVAFCQTVLPGNEAMLIPTEVTSSSTVLAVPDLSYWAGTAAHYYINPPGSPLRKAAFGVLLPIRTATGLTQGTNGMD
ncbi:hypothetical protein V1517DRAFT_371880 [Lipomyces orientalis]|uniref:Uncharacterized protein n=1 Tax=Lipomyces orientalis TaxID=1233043 RepID=A0ACC3TTL7_9ASCO